MHRVDDLLRTPPSTFVVSGLGKGFLVEVEPDLEALISDEVRGSLPFATDNIVVVQLNDGRPFCSKKYSIRHPWARRGHLDVVSADRSARAAVRSRALRLRPGTESSRAVENGVSLDRCRHRGDVGLELPLAIDSRHVVSRCCGCRRVILSPLVVVFLECSSDRRRLQRDHRHNVIAGAGFVRGGGRRRTLRLHCLGGVGEC